MIKRLRPRHTEEFLKELYQEPHDHWRYGRGHGLRVEMTKIITRDIVREVDAKSIADLSCGNAEIVNSTGLLSYLGDFAPGYKYKGPLEFSLHQIPNVDVYVCSETLEHLDDPKMVLSLIRSKSKSLILTTPINCWHDDNKEHYWAWDRVGVEELLVGANWRPEVYAELDSTVFGESYTYGIWGCL